MIETEPSLIDLNQYRMRRSFLRSILCATECERVRNMLDR